MQSLDIGVDLDGVVYDYVGILREWVQLTNGPTADPLPWPTLRSFHAQWGLTRSEFLALRIAAINARALYRHGTPIEGSIETLRDLTHSGHRIHIVTARAIEGAEQISIDSTEQWLDEYRVPYVSLTISADKTVVPTDIFLEDSATNYDALDAVGHNPWLYTQTWNMEHPGRRVKNWQQFAQVVSDLAVGPEIST